MTAVVLSMSDLLVGTPPSQLASHKLSMPLKEQAPQTMTTHSMPCPSPTSALESKCSSNAASSNSSHRSKRKKVDGAASNDLSMLQCASYSRQQSHSHVYQLQQDHLILALINIQKF